MQNKIKFNVKNSLEFTVESKFLTSVRNINTWFTSNKVSWIWVLVAAVTDIVGFISIFTSKLNVKIELIPVIVSGLSIAFEIAPLYIGYAICLYAYNFGKKVRKCVLAFSTVSFVLGIISNTVFRILNPDEPGTTIVMIILPIITSFMNLTVGCLSFDPLGMDVRRLSKLLKKLKLNLYKYKLFEKKLESDNLLEKEISSKEFSDYNSAKLSIISTSVKLKSYVDMKASEFSAD